MGTAPDAVKRLVVRFDQDRKVFLSGDYQAGTWDWGLGTRDPNPNPQPLAPNPSCAELGWDMDNKQGLPIIRSRAGWYHVGVSSAGSGVIRICLPH